MTEEKEKPSALIVRMSLRMLSTKHAESSSASSEATKLLIATVEKFSAAVEKAYNGNAVFAVVTLAERHSRAKRQTEEEVSS